MRCIQCAHYQYLNPLVGDCTANVPMWVPSYIIRDGMTVRPDNPADDCNCFKKATKGDPNDDDIAAPSNPYR